MVGAKMLLNHQTIDLLFQDLNTNKNHDNEASAWSKRMMPWIVNLEVGYIGSTYYLFVEDRESKWTYDIPSLGTVPTRQQSLYPHVTCKAWITSGRNRLSKAR